MNTRVNYAVFRDVTSCSLVGKCQCFGGKLLPTSFG
jgi:hypothetical protein